MQILYEIDDRIVPSIQQFLLTQLQQVTDPDTGGQVVRPIFSSPAEWINKQVAVLLRQIVQQYPPDYIRAKLAQAHALEQEIHGMVTPQHKQG